MMTAVPIEPEHLMRRLPKNNRHRVSAHPTGASFANSDRPTGREGASSANSNRSTGRKGRGGFMEPGVHASPMAGGTIHMLGGLPRLV